MKNRNEKTTVMGILSAILTLASMLIGVYVMFMTFFATVVCKLGIIKGSVRHTIAYFLSLIKLSEKMELDDENEEDFED